MMRGRPAKVWEYFGVHGHGERASILPALPLITAPPNFTLHLPHYPCSFTLAVLSLMAQVPWLRKGLSHGQMRTLRQ